jgi:hypothetical protein
MHSSTFVLHALPISSSLAKSFYLCLARSTSYEAPHYAVFSNLPSLHLFSDQIFSSAPCFQILSLCSSLNIRDQVSHPYRTTGKIIVLYILIFMFLDSRREDKVLELLFLHYHTKKRGGNTVKSGVQYSPKTGTLIHRAYRVLRLRNRLIGVSGTAEESALMTFRSKWSFVNERGGARMT